MKINKVNEMSENKITKSDLQDWMMNHGEDVVVDGPFRLSREQKQVFIDKINNDKDFLKQLRKEGVLEKGETIDDFLDLRIYWLYDKSCGILLYLFAEFLNEIGITEIPKY